MSRTVESHEACDALRVRCAALEEQRDKFRAALQEIEKLTNEASWGEIEHLLRIKREVRAIARKALGLE